MERETYMVPHSKYSAKAHYFVLHIRQKRFFGLRLFSLTAFNTNIHGSFKEPIRQGAVPLLLVK
jgi:hypothetical protein